MSWKKNVDRDKTKNQKMMKKKTKILKQNETKQICFGHIQTRGREDIKCDSVLVQWGLSGWSENMGEKKQKIDVCFEFLAFLLVISLNLLCAISFESKNRVTWGSEAKTFQDTYTEWLDECDETNNLSNMVDMPYWIYKTAFDKTEMVWGAFKDSKDCRWFHYLFAIAKHPYWF